MRNSRACVSILTFLLIATALAPMPSAADGFNCFTKLMELLRSKMAKAKADPEISAQTLSRALGVPKKAIPKTWVGTVQMLTSGENRANSLDAVLAMREDRVLINAGMTEKQIAALRSKGILKPLSPDALPDLNEWVITEVGLRPLDREALLELRGGPGKPPRNFGYIVDESGQLYLTDQPLSPKLNQLVLVRDSNAPAGAPPATVFLKESGTVQARPKTEIVQFFPEYGIDLSRQESSAIAKEARAKLPEVQFRREKNPYLLESTQLDCLALAAAQDPRSSWVVNNLIANNLVLGTSYGLFITTGQFDINEHLAKERIITDLIGVNAVGPVFSTLGRKMAYSDAPLLRRLGMRFGLGSVSTETHNLTNRLVIGDKDEEYVRQLSAYNRNFFTIGRTLWAELSERTIRNLPTYIYESCRKGNKLQAFLSPRGYRIAEKQVLFFLNLAFRPKPKTESDKPTAK